MMDYTFEYPEYDADGRLLERIGPDGKVTRYTYDELGRLKTAVRNYGLPTEEVGVTLYYDDADRLTEVRHEGPLGVLYKIEYGWTVNNWVDNRVEYDYTVPPGTSAFVDFEYDNRGRLIAESRVVDGTTTVYDPSYTYDQLGNRLTKFDAVSLLRTDYAYDVHVDSGEMGEYVTHHNRLLYYELYDTSETPEVLLRTVKYTYYKTGWASNITVIDEGAGPEYDWAQDLALYYYSHGDLHQALWGKYELDANGDPVPGTYETLGMREFVDPCQQRVE